MRQSKSISNLLFLLASLWAVSIIANAEKMANIDYLALGYNVYTGNPLSTSGVVDPGFLNSPIFQFVYDEGLTSGDGKWDIPNGMNAKRETACDVSFNSEVITGSKSYSNYLGLYASVEGSYFGASFSASSDFKSLSQGASSNKNIYTISKGECGVYAASLDFFNPPQLNANFLKAVRSTLLTNPTDSKFYKFYDVYGTHFISEVHMGSRLHIIYTLTQDGWASLESRGINVKASASYASLGYSFGASFGTESEKQQASAFNSESKNKKISSVGSPPPQDGNALTWASTSIESPMPMKYTLTQISELFDDKYLSSLEDEEKSAFTNLKAEIERTLQGYCAYLKGKGKVASCDAPTDESSLPAKLNSCRICARKCGGSFPVDQGTMWPTSNNNGWFFDYGPGCEGSYGHNEIYGAGAKLCCQNENSSNQGTCRICQSCGDDYQFLAGRVGRDTFDQTWALVFDGSCRSEPRNRPNPGNGQSICCTRDSMCSLCSSCGYPYPYEVGVLSANQNLPNTFYGRGNQCYGSDGTIGPVTFTDGIKLCCASQGPK